MYENGPYTVSEDGTSLERREVTWNSQYNMLYIDQPVGRCVCVHALGTSHCSTDVTPLPQALDTALLPR